MKRLFSFSLLSLLAAGSLFAQAPAPEAPPAPPAGAPDQPAPPPPPPGGPEGGPGRPGGRPPGGRGMGGPLLAALDANKDGKLAADEIANASKALLTLDKNADGELSPEELRPQPPPRGEGPQGRPEGGRPNGGEGRGEGRGRPRGGRGQNPGIFQAGPGAPPPGMAMDRGPRMEGHPGAFQGRQGPAFAGGRPPFGGFHGFAQGRGDSRTPFAGGRGEFRARWMQRGGLPEGRPFFRPGRPYHGPQPGEPGQGGELQPPPAAAPVPPQAPAPAPEERREIRATGAFLPVIHLPRQEATPPPPCESAGSIDSLKDLMAAVSLVFARE